MPNNLTIRAYVDVAGGHVHLNVFASLYRTDHMPRCGSLTFTVEEWPQVREGLSKAGWDLADTKPESGPGHG